jgi:hypothetical protein
MRAAFHSHRQRGRVLAILEARRLTEAATEGCSLPLDGWAARWFLRQAPATTCGEAHAALVEALESFIGYTNERGDL